MIVSDRKRQITLSVIGIFILIITILGVSYAVFNYARNGAKTNQIYTGSVSFSFSEGNDGIYLTDQYPTQYVDDVVKGAASDREKVTLNISSSISNGTIYYMIFIYNPDTSSTTGSAAVGLTEVNGSTPKSGYTVEKRLPDSCVALYIEPNSSVPVNFVFSAANDSSNNSYATTTSSKKGAHIGANPATNLLGPTPSASANNPTSKVLVAAGSVTAGNSGTLSLDLYGYIDSDRCTIIENEEEHENTYDQSGHRYYTQSDFGGRYYSFKVRVEADTDPNHWNSESSIIKNFSTNSSPFDSNQV